MNIKLVSSLIGLVAFLNSSVQAKRGGLNGGRGGAQGHGGHGNRPNGDNLNFTSIACDAAQGDNVETCDHPKSDESLFVCRERTDPSTNEVNSISVCIPTDKSLDGDVCGCCDGQDCPTPCDACPCVLENPRFGDEAGVLVLIEGVDEPVCVPSFASMTMVSRSNGSVTCATTCV
jgi:hypothetical protein